MYGRSAEGSYTHTHTHTVTPLQARDYKGVISDQDIKEGMTKIVVETK